MDVLRVHRDDKGSAHFMEQAAARIRVFVERYGGDGEALATQAWAHYASRSPLMGLWVGVDPTHPTAVVGHCLAFVQTWNGEPVGWVLQAEVDGPTDRAFRVAFHRHLDEWMHAYNAVAPAKVTRFMLSTPHDEEAWARFSGWRRYRTLFDRPVGRG